MRNDAYLFELMATYQKIPDDKKNDFMMRFNAQAKNPVVLFGVSIFLGSLGVDRFLLGQILFGFLKLFTFGGLGFWTIIDWFLVAGNTRVKNIEIARTIAINNG